MDRLGTATELLDGPLDDRAALEGNLRDLARVNRWLGGVALSRRALSALVAGGGAPIRLLDVGTGAADIPVALLRSTAAWATGLTVTAIDARPEVLEAAIAVQPALARDPRLTLEVADGTQLPYRDGTFDVTHASLLAHHLDRDSAVGLFREMARVARRGVVVNDLARGRLSYAGAWLLTRVATRNRYTRHDAPLSVRRAWRLDEMVELLMAADLEPVGRWRGFAGHRYAIAAVRGDRA
jgi:hypothetical protein